MPRNSVGIYTLPIGAFSPGGLIKADDHNQNYEDIATALTQSLATNISTPLTVPLFASQGSVVKPGIAFAGDTGTGFYKSGAQQIGWSYGGVQGGVFNNDTAGGVLFNGALTAPSLATSAAVAVGTALTVGTTAAVTGKLSLLSTDSLALPNGTTIQRNGSPSSGDFRYNNSVNLAEYWNGTAWVQLGGTSAVVNPTVQNPTGSGTVTPTVGVILWKVRMLAGGGGGGTASSVASPPNNATVGGDTVLGVWTVKGGGRGTAGNLNVPTGVSGTTSTGVNGVGTLIKRFQGTAVNGWMAGCAPGFGFGGQLLTTATSVTGANGIGLGSAGSGGADSVNVTVGGCGAGGEYIEFFVSNPVAVTYAVGAGGVGGTGGTFQGGNGTGGFLIIEEYYH